MKWQSFLKRKSIPEMLITCFKQNKNSEILNNSFEFEKDEEIKRFCEFFMKRGDIVNKTIVLFELIRLVVYGVVKINQILLVQV